jgi:LPPG:FO 2-phospho-L-lactate transferase
LADACLTAFGFETTAEAVARHYGARSAGGLLDGWLVDPMDSDAAADGIRIVAVPLWMRDPETSAALAGAALELATRTS